MSAAGRLLARFGECALRPDRLTECRFHFRSVHPTPLEMHLNSAWQAAAVCVYKCARERAMFARFGDVPPEREGRPSERASRGPSSDRPNPVDADLARALAPSRVGRRFYRSAPGRTVPGAFASSAETKMRRGNNRALALQAERAHAECAREHLPTQQQLKARALIHQQSAVGEKSRALRADYTGLRDGCTFPWKCLGR